MIIFFLIWCFTLTRSQSMCKDNWKLVENNGDVQGIVTLGSTAVDQREHKIRLQFTISAALSSVGSMISRLKPVFD